MKSSEHTHLFFLFALLILSSCSKLRANILSDQVMDRKTSTEEIKLTYDSVKKKDDSDSIKRKLLTNDFVLT